MIVRRLGKLWERMRGTVRNEPRDLEFQAEMEEHVRLLAERYRRQGMTSETAMLAAHADVGSLPSDVSNRVVGSLTSGV